MALLKCKMCGGDLEIAAGVTVAECEYCGTQQTLPKANDEVVQNLFNRANNLRIKCEFDKAEQIYEKILHENEAEAEAHWGIVLCKYGIEYVEDPKTYKRIPTCHRTSYDAVTTDADYLAAIEHADAVQKGIYEAEAKAIDAIQKNILNIVKNEQPFDVFICYKESEESGKRTVDSVIANDIYHQLTQEGLKVFYAAITLEDKLGQEYEPYIFAALNSAKVMLVIGTKPQYFNAVWVKNEWSRFLKLMKSDHNKLLIPCYKDMDAYDLPEEFSHLQAQDMSKIGFINDVVRGIKKVAVSEEAKPTVVKETVITEGNANTAPLLERAFMFLEDGDWNSANEYCEKVLDIEPKNAQAYLGKLMAELHTPKQEYLKNCREPFDNKNNYQKVIRFADENLKATLAGYIDHINTRNENDRLNGIYTRTKKAMAEAKTEKDYRQAAQQFETIPGYKDSALLANECYEKALNWIYTEAKNAMAAAKTERAYKQVAQQFESIPDYQDATILANECYEKAEIARKDDILAVGKNWMNTRFDRISDFEAAIQEFEKIPGWKDADEQIIACQKKIEEIKAAEEAARLERERNAEIARKEAERISKQKTRNTIIATAIACVFFAFSILWVKVIGPSIKYNKAVALMEEEKYTEAIATFEALKGHKDSVDKIAECNYKNAIVLMESGDKARAAICFAKMGAYQDAKERCVALWDEIAVREIIGAASFHTIGLKADGTMVAAGDNDDQCDVDDWTDIVAISAASFHTIGLKADGTVVAVGHNGNGECDVDDWTDIVAISTGYYHTVGLKADGTVVAAGDNDDQCDVDDWTDIVAISAGFYQTVGLKADGTVVAVGYNGSGQCNVDNWTDIVAISARQYHTVGLKADGTVVAVGSNDYGQCDLDNWTDIVAISAGFSHTVGLKADGTVVAVGYNDYGQCDVDDWTDIVAISAGDCHTVGLKADGTVVAVGYNKAGQCDLDDWTNIKLPQ